MGVAAAGGVVVDEGRWSGVDRRITAEWSRTGARRVVPSDTPLCRSCRSGASNPCRKSDRRAGIGHSGSPLDGVGSTAATGSELSDADLYWHRNLLDRRVGQLPCGWGTRGGGGYRRWRINLDERDPSVRTTGPVCSLDFVRQPLFKFEDMETLPPFDDDRTGLEDQLTTLTQAALDRAAAGVEIYVWGSKFEVGNRPVAADETYGDKVGVHDVHMNQLNPPPHQRDNGEFQDGGIIFHFTDRYVGVFMKFESQVVPDGAVAVTGSYNPLSKQDSEVSRLSLHAAKSIHSPAA